ncbi:hypothetical protein F0562_001764 [Nyssa sinensis]|uniref:Uncharacterized protein n=1 Tax=Nyssa sinensis TaxID=561372 RepID=A0A5J5C7X3_9ASTE|nr:hypothetical protein F0562_001764 [Nyssa sinensis]
MVGSCRSRDDSVVHKFVAQQKSLQPIVKDNTPQIGWRKGQLIGSSAVSRVYMGMNLSSRELLAVNRATISIWCRGFELVVGAADSQKLCKSRPCSAGYFGLGVGFCGTVQWLWWTTNSIVGTREIGQEGKSSDRGLRGKMVGSCRSRDDSVVHKFVAQQKSLQPIVKDNTPQIGWRKGQLIGSSAVSRVYMGMNLSSRELLAVNRATISIWCRGFELVVGAADSQKLCKSRPCSAGYFGLGVGFCGTVQVCICVCV